MSSERFEKRVRPHEPVYIAVGAAHDPVAILVVAVALLGAVRLLLDDGEVGAGAHMGELHPGRARGFPVSSGKDPGNKCKLNNYGIHYMDSLHHCIAKINIF